MIFVFSLNLFERINPWTCAVSRYQFCCGGAVFVNGGGPPPITQVQESIVFLISGPTAQLLMGQNQGKFTFSAEFTSGPASPRSPLKFLRRLREEGKLKPRPFSRAAADNGPSFDERVALCAKVNSAVLSEDQWDERLNGVLNTPPRLTLR